MRRIAFAIGLAAVIASCGPGDQPGGGSGSGYGSIVAQAVWPGDPGHPGTLGDGAFHPMVAPAGVESIVATVTGPGISTPVSATFNTTPGAAGSGAIANVPAGSNRTVTLSGFSADGGNGTKVYEGYVSAVTVTSGQQSNAGSIPMYDASPGILDGAFGTGGAGFITSVAGGTSATANAVAVDSQGRIVVVGTSNPSITLQMTVWRLLPTGALDTSFNSVGYVADPGQGTPSIGRAVLIDAQDRIVIAGNSFHNGGGSGDGQEATVWRFTESGVVDSSFGSGGYITSPTCGRDTLVFALATDSSGRYIAAGNCQGAALTAMVMRLTSSGTLDTTFDGAGNPYLTHNGPQTPSTVSSLAIEGNGSILAAGYDGPVPTKAVVWRIETVGAASYQQIGTSSADCDGGESNYFCHADTGAGSSSAILWSIAYDSTNSKIYGAGFSQNGAIDATTVWRLNNSTTVTLDTAYGIAGTLPFNPGTVNFGYGYKVLFDTSGRLLVAGQLQIPGTPNATGVAVWRYLSNGTTLDPAFNASGAYAGVGFKFASHSVDGQDLGKAMALTSAGKIVVAGQAANSSGGSNKMAVWQINP